MMDDLFQRKAIKPMLIGAEGKAFDSPDYLYELKLDGERCIAYLDLDGTDLRNKRNMNMLQKVPELSGIHKQVARKCILDGELSIIHQGKPDFFLIQRRSMMTNPLKIRLESEQHPACFTAFDILYDQDHPVTDLPLLERKRLLQSVVRTENARFAVSRYVEGVGVSFYQLAEEQELEGIVAKRKDSRYYFDRRTKDWIKCKYLKDSDYIICGFIPKENGMTSIVLGQFREKQLICKGHVTLGVSGDAFRKINELPRREQPPFDIPEGDADAVWVEPSLVCTVKYMMKTNTGRLHQPVFKGLRADKRPEDCVEESDG